MCKPGPKVIKPFSCSTQMGMEFIMLVNVKMPTIVGILTFISMINTASESLNAKNIFLVYTSSSVQLSMKTELYPQVQVRGQVWLTVI